MPRELNVADSFVAIWPDLPIPVNITLPWCVSVCMIWVTAPNSAAWASGDDLYKSSRCAKADLSVDKTCNALLMILLSGLKVLSSNSSMGSGGVMGRGSICSATGAHSGIDGVTGVGNDARYTKAIFVVLLSPPLSSLFRARQFSTLLIFYAKQNATQKKRGQGQEVMVAAVAICLFAICFSQHTAGDNDYPGDL